MNRGEIWEADLPNPIKRRPVLLLSRDSMPKGRPEITVAYLTTRNHHNRAEVQLTSADDGVRKDCVINLDSINTISKSYLLYPICTLSNEKMEEVAKAIEYALDLP
jgi:mRNA interferase MazF